MTTYRSILSLLCSYGVLLIANSLFSTIISIRSKTESFPDAIIGIVLAGYFAGLLLSSFYAVRVVALIGHIRSFALFASFASTVALMHLLWVNPFLWGTFRIISGFCMGGMIVVTEGWLNERADNNNRGSIMSVYMITVYACSGIAQLILMLGSSDGFRLFVFVSILYSLALIPILMTQSKAPITPESHKPNVKRLAQTSPVGVTGSFVVGFINGIFYALSPIFAHSLGLSLRETAIFMALSIMSGMLLQFPLGKFSDKIDRRWVIAFSSVATSVACYVLFRANANDIITLYLSGIFYGALAFSVYPICMAHINDVTPDNERTQTSGGVLMFYGIGAVVGPILAGFIMPFGVHFIYALSGSLALLFGIYTMIRLKVKPRPRQTKHRFKAFSTQSPARKFGFIQGQQESIKNK
ncbi:MAG: MFS transporter [Ostreibacterium sp.]